MMNAEERAAYQRRVDAQASCFIAVEHECDRQENEFGLQVHDPVYWFAVLGKQIGQLGEKVIDHKWAASKPAARAQIFNEATQVAAVAVDIMMACMLDEMPDEITSAVPRDPRQRAKALGHGDEQLEYDV